MEYASDDMTQVFAIVKLYLNYYWAVFDLRGDRARIDKNINPARSGTPVVLPSTLHQFHHPWFFISTTSFVLLLSFLSAITGYVAPRLLVCCRLRWGDGALTHHTE
jgi:hypothetical protein